MKETIIEHTAKLVKLGFSGTVGDLKTLYLLETMANRYSVQECNENVDEKRVEKRDKYIIDEVTKLFNGKLPDGFFRNRDPRGYSFKIESDKNIANLTRDWGDYGIVCPEL